MSEHRPDDNNLDETAIRQKPNDDKTRTKEKSSTEGESSAATTILQKPVANETATILREPAKDGSDNATIIRASTPAVGNDQATILRGASAENDATAVRPSADDDATVINPNIDDDATVIGGGGETDSDTTYIAAVGRQIESKGNSEAGRLLKNRFVLEEKVGSGGMGDVYKALDLRAQESQEKNPYIAVKMLNESFSRHKDAYQSLQREMAKTRGIPHKNIMGVYDFDREGDTVFMTMELLSGMPLDDYLKEHPEGVSTEDAWNIIDGICQGLSRAHGAGIVHSDFKPGNIFYTEEKIAKVFDFGIARAVSNPGDLKADGEKTVFDAGSLGALTPTYASYEMLKGMDPSKSDDVYAVALVAYELFTGKHPYDRVPADKALERGMTPSRIPDLKRRHWKVLKKALEIKGEDRTQSIDEFHEGMFSEDPPILRNMAIASVLLASVGFGVYSYLSGPAEEPQELQDLRLVLEGNENSLRGRLETPDWRSEVWHDQVFTGLARMQTANFKMDETWSEEVGEEGLAVNAELVTDQEAAVLQAYLEKIGELRIEASNLPNDWESVKQALKLLDEAKRYMGQVGERKYHSFNAGTTTAEKGVLDVVLQQRKYANTDYEEKDAKQKADEAAATLAAEELRVANEIEATRMQDYEDHLATLRNILRCKGEIPSDAGHANYSGVDELTLLGTTINSLKSTYAARYEVDRENIAKAIAGCIALRIAVAKPQRAREVKAKVMTYLPGESLISNIVINDKDPCTARGLEGRGSRSRSYCQDQLSGEIFSGPRLVVIPGIPRGITKFAISRTEIKIGDYNKYCDTITDCNKLQGETLSIPATNLTLAQANAYAAWLSEKSGREYRLPTVEEWHHAARTDELKVDANVNCTVDSRGVRLGEKLLSALSGRPNNWGLYNFVGNAREWVIQEDGSIRAVGGAHTDPKSECSIDKWVAHNGEADPVTGFRILRQIES